MKDSPCRRDQLRFLKMLDSTKFVDGVKEQLTDLQIGMAFWLACGLPPWHKLREMRCKNLGTLSFGCNGQGVNGMCLQLQLMLLFHRVLICLSLFVTRWLRKEKLKESRERWMHKGLW